MEDLIEKVEKLEKKMEEQQKEMLQQMYSKGTSVCDGSIFDVPFPVVHLGRKLLKRKDKVDEYDDLNILDYGGRSRVVKIQFAIHVESKYPIDVDDEYPINLDRKLMVHKGKFERIRWSITESELEVEGLLDLSYHMKSKEFQSTKYILDKAKQIFKDAGLLNVFNENINEAVVWYSIEE